MLYSINEYAIASRHLCEVYQINCSRNEAQNGIFNRRLDITELRTFTNLSAQEIRSLYEALQESKEFNNALNSTKHIASVLQSKYPKGIGDADALATSRNY